MHPYQDAAGESGKDIEHEDGRVRVHERSMRSVEEDDIALGELFEHGQVRSLERRAQHAVAELVHLDAGRRVDGHDCVCNSPSRHARAANFVDSPEPIST